MYELNDVVRKLGEAVIEEHENFHHLKDITSPCRIAYMYSDEKKRHNGKLVFAGTTKMSDMIRDLTGYDFAIVFYGCAVDDLPDNVLTILMYHELLHVGYEPETRKRWLIPHDVEDFSNIITQYGIDWVLGIPCIQKKQEAECEQKEAN